MSEAKLVIFVAVPVVSVARIEGRIPRGETETSVVLLY